MLKYHLSKLMARSEKHIAEKILDTLAYFDVFSYPLTLDELLLYTDVRSSERTSIDITVKKLAKYRLGGQHKEYVYLGSCPSIVKRRIDGNLKANLRFRQARFYSMIISYFPFVRGVFLSGSIAKGFMTDNDDIDYFIITSPGRLWIVRSLLTLFKKIFLLNSHRNFCINYFVDEKSLYIREQNRFTATELAFLVPMYDMGVYELMISENQWVRCFYPFYMPGFTGPLRNNYPLVKRISEYFMKGSMFDKLDRYLQGISQKYIRRKFSHMDKDSFDQAFSIKPHELRFLPNRRQFQILKQFRRKKQILRKHFETPLFSEEKICAKQS